MQEGKLRLQPVSVANFRSLLFVNLSTEGPSLDEVLDPLADIQTEWAGLALAETRTYRVQCNWKVAVENALDVTIARSPIPAFRAIRRISIRLGLERSLRNTWGRPESRRHSSLSAHWS